MIINQKGKTDKTKLLGICKKEEIKTVHTEKENDKGTKKVKKFQRFNLILINVGLLDFF